MPTLLFRNRQRVLSAFVPIVAATSALHGQASVPRTNAMVATEIVAFLRASQFDSAVARFSPDLRREISATRLEETWKSLVQTLGEPLRVDSARMEEDNVVVPIAFRAIGIAAGFTFTARNEASSFALRPVRSPAAATTSTTQSSVVRNGTPGIRDSSTAERLFAAGLFDASAVAARSALERNENVNSMRVHLASIALLRGNAEEARSYLRDVAGADSATERRRWSLEGEAASRLHDYAAAAKAYEKLGRAPMAAKMRDLATRSPQPLTIPVGGVRIPFIRTDPLPVVKVSVNGRDDRYFLIDTGAGETILDTALARAVGVRRFGADTAMFAGGNRTSVEHGSADSVKLGAFVMRNVPVRIQPTRAFAMAGGGLAIDGVIGTGMFREVRATLDYPAGELRVHARSSPLTVSAAGFWRPMWLAGDHFMVAWGQTGTADSSLMLLDTGLVGATFVAPDTVFRRAGFGPSDGERVVGIGGAGPVEARIVTLDSLRFGGASLQRVPSMMGVFPAQLEHQFGFPIRGLISHAFLRQYAVTFDFDAMRVGIVPVGTR